MVHSAIFHARRRFGLRFTRYVDQRWSSLESGGRVQILQDQADHVIVATTLRYAHFRL